ncbi:MAG: exodeoxyribonuclease III [Rickettsiales bacterium]|nr:MAG: exodeoxyribonuclease III [Rickettsiales bacterium]
MKIATWNVNSIRMRIANLIEFVNKEKPDVILLQELKCVNEQFPFLEFETLGYNIEVFGQKGGNGVAIFSKYRLEEVKKEYFDSNPNEARYIEGCFSNEGKYYKVASIYVPNGGPKVADGNVSDITKTETFYNKMKFFDLLKEKIKDSKDDNAFFCGDWNVCPNLYKDVYTTSKDGDITNTEAERQKFKELLNDCNVCDVWRDLNLDLQDYTWWGYRPMNMFQKNQGYRLDAILTSLETKKIVKKCWTCREIREQEKPSDHIPMIAEINC